MHNERLGIYNLPKKGHDVTYDVNSVHSETMGVYNLAKKRTTLLIIQMQCTLHSERLGVYNLARKIKTFSMHEKINYHGLLSVLMMEMQCIMKDWVHCKPIPCNDYRDLPVK